MQSPRASPTLKKEIGKSMPHYMNSKTSKGIDAAMDMIPDSSDPMTFRSRDPADFMKHMDTSFESFFYQREYSEPNFSFYLQVLAS